jgi:RNA polymerase sigma-70 factor (ECF subfamily)
MIVAAAPHLPRVPTEHEQMLVARYLGDRFTAAQRGCPGIVVAPEVFWPYFAARLPARQTLDALDEVHFHDLYLACACQAGDRRALELIDRRYIPSAFAGIEKVGLSEARVAGLTLELRRQLFLAERGRTPKISAYSGRGSLVAWLRTLVQRAAAEIMRQDRLAVPRVRRR